jgi:hypothetical protein
LASPRNDHSGSPRLRGLLRGACHRARIRATRWLAMTAECNEKGALLRALQDVIALVERA